MSKCEGCLLTDIPQHTIQKVASWLGIKPESIHRLILRHKNKLRPPAYKREGKHPRRVRVLYPSDVRQLILLTRRGIEFQRRLEAMDELARILKGEPPEMPPKKVLEIVAKTWKK